MKKKNEIQKALELCNPLGNVCLENECPYYEENVFSIGECINSLHKDVTEFIFTGSEPVEKDEFHFYCGECGLRLRLKLNLKYCPRCGVKIKWTNYTNGSTTT